jgi:hypothetical protein
LSAVSARFASGTTAVPTAKAVPDKPTNNATSATAIEALAGRTMLLLLIFSSFRCASCCANGEGRG